MNSYAPLNSFFFNITPFNTVADIELLKPFFFTDQKRSISKPLSPLAKIYEPIKTIVPLLEQVPIPPIKKPIIHEKPKKTWFDPYQRDTLFWCVYAGVFGMSEYMLIGTKYANREWEEKNAAIVAFQKCAKELRTTNHKITLGNIQEMMSEYMTNQSNITLLGLVGLSVYYKIQIYLIDSVKKTHLVYTPENYSRTCYIYKHDKVKGKYRLSLIENDLANSFCLVSFTRPLRSISTYKLSELEEIARRFGINDCQKKDALYKEIAEHIVWL